jgi:hypothetical protein
MRSSFAACALALGLGAPAAAADPEPLDARVSAARVDQLVVAMGGTSEQVRHMLRKARSERSARRVACLDEALSRVDAALRVSRDEARAAHAAAEEDDAREAALHLAKVARLREVSRAAAAAGAACAMGQPFPEGTTVRVIVDPAIAQVGP